MTSCRQPHPYTQPWTVRPPTLAVRAAGDALYRAQRLIAYQAPAAFLNNAIATGTPYPRSTVVAQQLPVAELFQPDVLASQAAMLTAGLMMTSAALGFSARSLVDALTLAADREGPAEGAWQPAEQNGADAWHMPPIFDLSGPESSTAIESETITSRSAAEGAVPAVTTPDSSRTPEHVWDAAWQTFEPAAVPSAGSTMAGQSVDTPAGWLPRLRMSRGASQRHPRQNADRRAAMPDSPATTEEGPDQVLRAQLALQGIAPRPRLQLLACAMSALEQQIGHIAERQPDRIALETEEWGASMLDLLAASERAAAQAWLGYVPAALAAEAPTEQQGGGAGSVGGQQPPGGEPTDADASYGGAYDGGPEVDNSALHGAIVAHLARMRRDRSAAEAVGSQAAAPAGASASEEARAAVAQAERLDGQPSRRQQAASLLAGSSSTIIRGWGHDRSAAAAGGQRGQGWPAAIAPSLLRSAPAVLQDMAVIVAESVADAYLAEASAGAGRPGSAGRSGQGAGSWPLFLHRRIASTRALERFRNQVALQRWVAANVTSVVALYEDRHDLWGFTHQGRLIRRALPARRAKDVSGLRGVRYAVGIALEALDFVAPLLQRVLARLGDALAWLLVRLIGRSLGLVYRGVRESLAPLGRRNRPPPPGQAQRRGPPRPRYAPL